MTRDQYYFDLCNTVAKASKCLSRKIGAIIVRDKSIISTGYNGPPRNVPHCVDRRNCDQLFIDELEKREVTEFSTNMCPRRALGFKSGEGLEWCIAGHAERNAIVNAARHGVSVNGAKMYMNCGTPCTPCLIEIINAGIEEIIITKAVYYDKMAEWLLDNSDLKWRVYEKGTV